MKCVMMITLIVCLTGCQALGSGCDCGFGTSEDGAEPPRPVAEEGDGYRSIFTRFEIGYSLRILPGTAIQISTRDELRSFLALIKDQSPASWNWIRDLDEGKIDVDFSSEALILGGVFVRTSIPGYVVNAYWVDEKSLQFRRDYLNGDEQSADSVVYLDMFAVDVEKVETVRFDSRTFDLTESTEPAFRLLFSLSDRDGVIEFDGSPEGKATTLVIRSPEELERLMTALASMDAFDKLEVAKQILRGHPVDFDRQALALFYGGRGEIVLDGRRLVASAPDEDEVPGRIVPALTGVLLDLEQLDALEVDGEFYELETRDKGGKQDK